MEQASKFHQGTSLDHRWPVAARIGFRFTFCYFMLYLFCNGNVSVFTPLDDIPWIGGVITGWLAKPFRVLSLYAGTKIFHLTGIAATFHRGGSGDTALSWIMLGVFLVVAFAATAIWSVLDRKRAAYPVLYAWLRFAIRLTLGVSMILYGLVKVFPLQMRPPTLGVLNEPFGQMSPESVLWSMLGFSPIYERICGSAELVAGVLLLIRRTSLAGALLTAFVMTNVLLYNIFFDVPVKLFAAHLVLLACFVTLPDLKPLFRFFVLNKPAEPVGVWVPPVSRREFRRATMTVEVCYLLLALIVMGYTTTTAWKQYTASLAPSPLVGSWTLIQASPRPMTTPEGRSWTNIYFDDTTRAMVRDTSGQLWRYYLDYDATKKTVQMRGPTDYTLFTWRADDPEHLTLAATKSGLTPPFVNVKSLLVTEQVPPDPKEVLQLEREPTIQSYPLYTRGFHLVNEWGYER